MHQGRSIAGVRTGYITMYLEGNLSSLKRDLISGLKQSQKSYLIQFPTKNLWQLDTQPLCEHSQYWRVHLLP